MPKYTVKAFGKRGNQYGPTKVASKNEAIGRMAEVVTDLLGDCQESEITVEIEEIA